MAVSAKPPADDSQAPAGQEEPEPGFRTLSGEPVREPYTAADLPAGIGAQPPEDPIGQRG